MNNSSDIKVHINLNIFVILTSGGIYIMKFPWIVAFLLIAAQSSQLTVNYDGEPIEIITENSFYLPYFNSPFVNLEKYSELENKIENQIYKPPKNAKLDKYGNIVEEEIGITLNKKVFAQRFFGNLNSHGTSSIEVPTIPIYPKVDSEILSQIKTNRVSHYLTFFRTSNKERSHNISLAVEAINNHVVFPGETFSFNKVVGKRTKDKGYKVAPIIVRGELTEGIGGGICQVSSTLFNAVDRAGLKIIERYSHSKNVSYVPPGRDATVSWYGPDFIFKNNYNQPLLIRAKAIEGKVIIMIYSSDEINLEPKKIPSSKYKLPEETTIDQGFLH